MSRDLRAAIREFLVSRRARLSPEQVGLSRYGGHRRVPGLRREELAVLAGDGVGSLRTEAAREPHDQALAALIGELSVRSEDFRVRWARHDVRYYRSGTQPFRHPLVGELTLDYDALEIPADPGHTIVAYTAAAGSPAQEALHRLLELSTAPQHWSAVQPR
jgi:hypothetical protein